MINVYRDISEVNKDENTAVTLGTFDGLHVGHQDILKVLIEKATKCNCRNFVITFEPHPRLVLSKENGIKILTPLDEKVEVFEKYGVENLLVISFTKTFAEQTSEKFIEDYIINKVGAKEVIIGYDHKFGKNRDGDESTLRELAEKHNFGLTVAQAKTVDGETVSSTKIRKALHNADLEKVNSFLGRKYILIGEIVKGAGRGRSLGFPTANVELDDKNKLIPQRGVYAVSCNVGGEILNGVMNIGLRPTFENLEDPVIEVNLFNFDREIYNETIKIEIHKRIRDERKFNSKEELINQIENDKKEAIELTSNLVN